VGTVGGPDDRDGAGGKQRVKVAYGHGLLKADPGRHSAGVRIPVIVYVNVNSRIMPDPWNTAVTVIDRWPDLTQEFMKALTKIKFPMRMFFAFSVPAQVGFLWALQP
jgi:hypothetical protein